MLFCLYKCLFENILRFHYSFLICVFVMFEEGEWFLLEILLWLSFLILYGNLGFPCGSAGKESACNAGDLGAIPGLGRSLGEGKGYTLQYSGLENSMDSPWDRKELDMASPTWWTWVWVNSRRWWWTGRPGVLRFMGSQRVRHDWETELNWATFTFPFRFHFSWQLYRNIIYFVCIFIFFLDQQ